MEGGFDEDSGSLHDTQARHLYHPFNWRLDPFRPALAVATIDSSLAEPETFDHAVPDAPAFKLLEVDPNSILRPGTRREIAVTVEDASLQNFAIECATFLIARDGQIALATYRKYRPLYNLRISVGTKTPEGGPTGAAIGVRLSIFDSGDPYTNRELLAAAAEAGADIQRLRTEAEHAIRDSLGSPEKFAELDPRESEALIEARIASDRQAAEQAFETARDHFKEEWHRDSLELAFAASGQGSTTSPTALRATAYAAWLTGAKRLGTRGQILAGGSGRLVRNDQTDSVDSGEGSMAFRFYYGSKFAKAASSADVAWSGAAHPKYAGSVGTEVRLFKTIWATANVGLTKEGFRDSEVTSDLSLRYGMAGVIPLASLLRGAVARSPKKVPAQPWVVRGSSPPKP